MLSDLLGLLPNLGASDGLSAPDTNMGSSLSLSNSAYARPVLRPLFANTEFTSGLKVAESEDPFFAICDATNSLSKSTADYHLT